MNLTRVVLAAGLSYLLCGCGTIDSFVGRSYHERPSHPPDDYQPPDYVYGGVKSDLWHVRQCFRLEDAPLIGKVTAPLFLPLFLADIPLSAVGDTLALRITIQATEREAKWWREANEMQWAEFGGDGDPPLVKTAGYDADAKSESSQDRTAD